MPRSLRCAVRIFDAPDTAGINHCRTWLEYPPDGNCLLCIQALSEIRRFSFIGGVGTVRA